MDAKTAHNKRTRTLKIISVILDVICCICGILTIIAGAYTLLAFNHSDEIRIPCILSIVLGSLLFLCPALGAFAAHRDNIKLTWIYVLILMVLLGAQITVMYIIPLNFEQLALETVNNAWQGQFHNSDAMSRLEIKHECCGKNGPNNYITSGLEVPPSCFPHQNTTNQTEPYSKGCTQTLTEIFNQGTRWERTSDWVLISIEAITIAVAGMFAISLQNAQRRGLYA